MVVMQADPGQGRREGTVGDPQIPKVRKSLKGLRLEPSSPFPETEDALAKGEDVFCSVPEVLQGGELRPAKPRDKDLTPTILPLVIPAPHHVVSFYSPFPPVPNGKPLHRFVRPQVLVLTPACPAPEIHAIVERREDPRSYAEPIGPPSPYQEQVPRGKKVFQESTHPFPGIGGDKPLFPEHVLELRVVFISKSRI